MNNKGQSLVLFVLILPLIIMFLALLINSSIVYYNKIKVTGAIESNLDVILEKDIMDVERIKDVIRKNLNNDKIDIKIENNKIYLYFKMEDKFIFDKFLMVNKKEKEYYYCGDYDTNVWYQNEECL